MPVSAVVFDLDGTLVDSADHYYGTFHRLLTELGITDFDRDAYNAAIGRSTRDMLAGLRARYALTVSVDALVRRTEELYLRDLDRRVTVFPYMRRILRAVRDRGLPTAVASGSPQGIIEAVLSSFGLSASFDHVVTAEHAGAGKPDPRIFRCAARALRTAPRSCLAFEDSAAGVTAAVGAGLRCIVIPAPELRADDPAFARADLSIPGDSPFAEDTVLRWIDDEMAGGAPRGDPGAIGRSTSPGEADPTSDLLR